MTAEGETLLRTLEARVTQMALEHQALKARYQALSEEMMEKDETIKGLNAQVVQLKQEYTNLKTARMIDISSTEMKDAKSRISKLVREVDKCIALLNV